MSTAYRAIILARISDQKQKIKGDSLDDQIFQCRNYIEKQKWTLGKIFPIIESGRKGDRNQFQEVLDYCKSRQNTSEKIDYLVIKNIGRLTRKGSVDYLKIKGDLKKINVDITDIYGTIGKSINLMSEYGFEYDFGNYQPTEASEMKEADNRKQYVRDQLCQMIGGCIRNIRKGYWNGPAPYGLMNKKAETKDGIRNILVENPKEDYFMQKILTMRATGISDKEIVATLNLMGFKSRVMAKRDLKTKEKIGSRGGVPLTVKKIQEFVVNPIYCGIIVVKWTNYQPVKAAMFDGLVDIETFNAANKGKIYIVKNDDNTFTVKHNVRWAGINQPDKRLRYNPEYPLKTVTLCPLCKKEAKASASRSGSGKKIPVYFCDRKHKRWHESKTNVHTTITNFVSDLEFSPEMTSLFDEAFLGIWKEKRLTAVKDSEVAENYVAKLANDQVEILESIKKAESQLVRRAFEADYETLEMKLKEARGKRNTIELKEANIKDVLAYANYLMEHPKELLIDTDNMLNQRHLFGLVFKELPTYDELVNGTAKLNHIFQLKRDENVSKSDLVQQVGVEPTLDSFTDCCLTVRLLLE